MNRKLMVAMALVLPISAVALDQFTVSRLQAKINERRIVSRSIVVENGITNTVTVYRQSGAEWSQTNSATVFTGCIAPVRYSTLALLTAIADTGRYAEVKSALQSATLPNGMPYWDAMITAQYLRADDPRLQTGVDLAVQSGLCTREEAKAILKKAED